MLIICYWRVIVNVSLIVRFLSIIIFFFILLRLWFCGILVNSFYPVLSDFLLHNFYHSVLLYLEMFVFASILLNHSYILMLQYVHK